MSAARPRQWLRKSALMLLAIALTLVILEGLASLATFAYRASRSGEPALAERNHTRYDAELGWVNIPDTTVRDLYGRGIDLTIDSRGFRASGSPPAAAGQSRTKVVCSGDSFTLGYGVRDSETWCAQLSALDPRLETVNMGQGGYGVDQAYLWFMRDGRELGADVHLFAFIFDDFLRMSRDRFLGYGKPVLRLDEAGLVVDNVPVPRRAYLFPWFTQNSKLLDELRSFAALRSLVRRVAPAPSPDRGLGETLRVAFAAFEQLRAHHERADSKLVLIYLPVEEDYVPGAFDGLRERVADWSAAHGVEFFDLVPDFRSMAPEQALRLFIPEGGSEFPDAAGHYSRTGNRIVAGFLERRLRGLSGSAQSRMIAPGSTAGD